MDYFAIAVGFVVVSFVVELWLDVRQRRLLRVTEPPRDLLARHRELREHCDAASFARAQAYGRAKNLFGMLVNAKSTLLELAMLLCGAYPYLWALAGRWVAALSAATTATAAAVNSSGNETVSEQQQLSQGLSQEQEQQPSEYLQSLVFLGLVSVVDYVLSLPEDLYGTFVLEARFGFNRQTWRTYVLDAAKTAVLSAVLGVPVVCGTIAIVRHTGRLFALYLALFVAAVSGVVMVLYPVVLLPLFNTLTPLGAGALRDAVAALAARTGFRAAQIAVMDGSTRSAHSNAFVTGVGAHRRIVLYDTLVAQLAPADVCAVLAHELGHWRRGHTLRAFALACAHNGLVFALFARFLANDALYRAFGFALPAGEHPVVVGLALFLAVYEPVDSLFAFLLNALLRRFEYEADADAVALGYDLATALVKVSRENSSTLLVDPLYSAYHYDHPTLLERLSAIDALRAKAPLPSPDTVDEGADSAEGTVSDAADAETKPKEE